MDRMSKSSSSADIPSPIGSLWERTARPARPEENRSARSSRQLNRFYHSINSDEVFGTHRAYKQAKAGIEAGEAKFQVDSEAPAALPAPGPDAAAGR
jgi:hypothetical protein